MASSSSARVCRPGPAHLRAAVRRSRAHKARCKDLNGGVSSMPPTHGRAGTKAEKLKRRRSPPAPRHQCSRLPAYKPSSMQAWQSALCMKDSASSTEHATSGCCFSSQSRTSSTALCTASLRRSASSREVKAGVLSRIPLANMTFTEWNTLPLLRSLTDDRPRCSFQHFIFSAAFATLSIVKAFRRLVRPHLVLLGSCKASVASPHLVSFSWQSLAAVAASERFLDGPVRRSFTSLCNVAHCSKASLSAWPNWEDIHFRLESGSIALSNCHTSDSRASTLGLSRLRVCRAADITSSLWLSYSGCICSVYEEFMSSDP
mmetsp:Transcript_33024/g.60544  ORF Transcript_33024/g.60544 Transcript_33024/m.60544 type:complete len:317 (-) Transcript_33024:257-1207(-)